jgi:rhodanese-related sulfurtransferase
MNVNELLTAVMGSLLFYMVVMRILAARNRINGTEARALVADGAMLLDVRTNGEFSSGHIDGAKNVPLHELGSRLDRLSKKKPVVVYCRSGARSARAARMLQKAGYTVHDLGPLHAW